MDVHPEKTFSLLLPTRGRPDAVRELLNSLKRTTRNPEQIELILYLDEDDALSHEIEDDVFTLVKLIRPRAVMGVMTCECYRFSSGRYLMLANDDVVFRTEAWDRIVAEALGAWGDGIALAWGNDLVHGARFATHPFLTRRFCEILGGPCPTTYIHDYIDVHLFDTMRHLAGYGHRRLVYLPQVVIEHRCVGRERKGPGRIAPKLHSAADLRTYILRDEERRRAAAELAEVIESHRAELKPESVESAS